MTVPGTPPREAARGNVSRLLTIGVVVADDCQIQHSIDTLAELCSHDRLEILIVADHTYGSSLLSALGQRRSSAELRWLPREPGTAAVNAIFAHALGDWVLFLQPGTRLHDLTLSHFENYIAAHPQCPDLLQGPVTGGPRQRDRTHLEPVWHRGRLGVPGDNPVPASETSFEIGMQDLAVFACRKDSWPGIDPRLDTNVGPPGYLHKMFRARGGRTLSLPFLRYSAADDAPLPAWTADEFFRYLLCWENTGQAIEPILEHYTEGRGAGWVDQHLAHWEAARNNPFDAFDAIVCINSDQQPQRWTRIMARFAALGIAHKVARLPAIRTPERYQLGCALSHRRALDMARQQGLRNILVFEDDAVFLNGTTWVLRHAVRELMQLPWKLFYLGGFYSDQRNPLATDDPVSGTTFLRHAPGLVTTHAIAYHQQVFDQLLDELPTEPEAMRDLLDSHGGHIDVYYSDIFKEGVYRCTPTVASQESYVHLEHPLLRDQFLFHSGASRG